MAKRCLCIRHLPFFERAEQGLFGCMICRKAAQRRYYQRGDTFFRQGDPCDAVYLIKEGSIKLVHVTEDGKEVILQVVGKGEVLGEASLFREEAHLATAIVIEDARVCVVTRQRMEDAIRKSPDLALQVITSLGNRLYEAWEQVTNLNTGNTREKIINLLVRLASEHGEKYERETIIRLYLTQQEIADFVGASRVMVAHALKELTTSGLLRKDGKHYVLTDKCPLAQNVK